MKTDYETQAKRLASHLKQSHDIDLSHGHCLEAIAAIHGHKGWNELSTAEGNGEQAPVSFEEKFCRIFLLSPGTPLDAFGWMNTYHIVNAMGQIGEQVSIANLLRHIDNQGAELLDSERLNPEIRAGISGMADLDKAQYQQMMIATRAYLAQFA
jgi:hypothetical protein